MEHDDSGSTIGKGMLFVAWILALGALSWYFQGYLEDKNNPNQAPETRFSQDGLKEITLVRNGYGHYVSAGFIDGYPVTFFLDTGATAVSVPAHIADQIGLRRGPQLESSTANGTITVYATLLDEVRIGDIALRDVRGTINPYMEDDEILLGMSFLKYLELIQRGNTLTIRQ